jgi:ABC-type dipeptide/oligopeptide/nickel transport system permease component
MWLLRRVLSVVFMVWLALTLVFFMLRLIPGDAVSATLRTSGASEAVIAERRAALGLDLTPFEQYVHYLGGVSRGDFGVSLLDGQPAAGMIAQQLDSTLALAFSALLVALSLGLVLGCAASFGLGRGVSRLARAIIGLAMGMPIYWTGTLAVFVFSAQWRLLPSSDDGTWRGLILPATVLGFHLSGAIARVTWASITETLRADFVRTARGKGLNERRVIVVHVLRVGLPPILTTTALQVGFLLGGAVVTEALFSRPGLGRLLLAAVLQGDYPIVQAVVVWSAAVYAVVMLAADGVSWLLDVRVRELSV